MRENSKLCKNIFNLKNHNIFFTPPIFLISGNYYFFVNFPFLLIKNGLFNHRFKSLIYGNNYFVNINFRWYFPNVNSKN